MAQAHSAALLLAAVTLAVGVPATSSECYNLLANTNYPPGKPGKNMESVCGQYLKTAETTTCCTEKVLDEYVNFLSSYSMCRSCNATVISMMCHFCSLQNTPKKLSIDKEILEKARDACVYNQEKDNKTVLLKKLCRKKKLENCKVDDLLKGFNAISQHLKVAAGSGEQSFNPPVYSCYEPNPLGKCCSCGDCSKPCNISGLFADLNITFTFRSRTLKSKKEFTTVFVSIFLVFMYTTIIYFMWNRYPREPKPGRQKQQNRQSSPAPSSSPSPSPSSQ